MRIRADPDLQNNLQLVPGTSTNSKYDKTAKLSVFGRWIRIWIRIFYADPDPKSLL